MCNSIVIQREKEKIIRKRVSKNKSQTNEKHKHTRTQMTCFFCLFFVCWIIYFLIVLPSCNFGAKIYFSSKNEAKIRGNCHEKIRRFHLRFRREIRRIRHHRRGRYALGDCRVHHLGYRDLSNRNCGCDGSSSLVMKEWGRKEGFDDAHNMDAD